MDDYIYFIENKIKKNVDVEKIIILDNSHKHAKHKYFQADKRHLYLEIESKFLSGFKIRYKSFPSFSPLKTPFSI